MKDHPSPRDARPAAGIRAGAPASRTDGPADARALAALDLRAHLADPARKQAFVTPMFDVIAPRYDTFTRRFSFGMDRGWKRATIDAAVAALGTMTVRVPGPLVLDVASGTGDLAAAIARAVPKARVIGLDASTGMGRQAAARLRDATADADVASRVRVATGDLAAPPLPEASVDLILGGYALRNAPSLDASLAALYAVLRPGGALVTLDFHPPASGWWRRVWLAYLRIAGNVVGWWRHRVPVVYGYIADSIEHFVTVAAYGDALTRAGFVVERSRTWMGGGIALVVARRPGG